VTAGIVLQYAANTLKQDEEVVLAAVKSKGFKLL